MIRHVTFGYLIHDELLLLFRMCYSLHVAVSICIYCSFFTFIDYLQFLKISLYGKIIPMAYHNVGLLGAKLSTFTF